MRKADYLRKVYNKCLKEGSNRSIYYMDLPSSFLKKGDVDVAAEPYSDAEGLCGIAVEHLYRPYAEEGNIQIFSYYECFAFRKVIPVTV